MPSNVCLGYKYHGSRIILILGNYSSRKSAHGILNLGQKPHDKKPPNKSPPTISPRYKKIGAGFFLGLVDPSRNRLASTAYFSIISSITLGVLLPGGFCLGGILSGAFNRLPENSSLDKSIRGNITPITYYSLLGKIILWIILSSKSHL